MLVVQLVKNAVSLMKPKARSQRGRSAQELSTPYSKIEHRICLSRPDTRYFPMVADQFLDLPSIPKCSKPRDKIGGLHLYSLTKKQVRTNRNLSHRYADHPNLRPQKWLWLKITQQIEKVLFVYDRHNVTSLIRC